MLSSPPFMSTARCLIELLRIINYRMPTVKSTVHAPRLSMKIKADPNSLDPSLRQM